MANFSGRSLAILAAGGLLAYSAVKGNTVSGAIRSFVTGNDPGSAAPSLPIGDSVASGSATAGVEPVATPNLGNSAATNRAMGRLLAASYGWTGNEWVALDDLWTRESGWSNTAENPGSKAYGIPKALPASKLPKSGQPAAMGGNSSSSAQIAWGLQYIRGRYGSPLKAESHENQFGWY